MKKCVECKFGHMGLGYRYWCSHPENREPIYANALCSDERDTGACGIDGVNWQAQPPEPAKISFWRRIFA